MHLKTITLNEFRHIKEFAKKERLKELKKFKLQVKNNEIEKELNKNEIKSLSKEVIEKSKNISLVTDSKYVKEGIESWIINWKKNGWKTASKKPVKNKELWVELDELIFWMKRDLKNFLKKILN